MNDKEITEIIATKVRGWVRHNIKTHYWVLPECKDKTDLMRWDVLAADDNSARRFSPPDSDNDCMLAWDKFSKTIGGLNMVTGFSPNHGEVMTEVNAVLPDNEYIVGNTMDIDRRRAMCLCMVKAVGQ